MPKPIVCIGAALVDETFSTKELPVLGTSNPASYFHSMGGVACNIANHLALLGLRVELISHFGEDADGKWLMESCQNNGLGIGFSLINQLPTGRFVAILSPEGDLFTAVSVSPVETEITVSFLQQKIEVLKIAALLVLDCNLSSDVLRWLLEFCSIENIPAIVEPVSVAKSARLKGINLQSVLLLTPNQSEMRQLVESTEKDLGKLANVLLNRGVNQVWVRNGKLGSTIFSSSSTIELAAPSVEVVDTTGAGDSALAGWIYGWMNHKNPETCLRYGHALAGIVLQTKGSLQAQLTAQMLEKQLI